MKIHIKGGIFKRSISSEFYPGEIFFSNFNRSFGTAIFLAPYIIDIEIPDVDTSTIEIAALKEAISKETADHSVRIAAFENAIANLLCIENNPREA